MITAQLNPEGSHERLQFRATGFLWNTCEFSLCKTAKAQKAN